MQPRPTTLGKWQGLGLSVLSHIAQSELTDRLGLRKRLQDMLYSSSKNGFRLATATSRLFKSTPSAEQVRLRPASPTALFDLSLSDEQQMVVDNLARFAREVMRPAAHTADSGHTMSAEVLSAAHELGLLYYAIPEEFGGMATEQQLTPQMLALETLAHGDLGLTVALSTSLSVANLLSRYGTADQQQRYLPALLDTEQPAVATLAVLEPVVGFDPVQLHTTARRDGSQVELTGQKTLVARGTQAELFVVAAMLDGQPGLFVVESSTPGLSLVDDPAMGLHAAETVRLQLDQVRIPAVQQLDLDYREFLDLSRLASCTVAVGTAQAVLDYVSVYVNEREAFGEPISHRQSVAFMVADMATELEAMRLMTWRAVARAEHGLPFHREAHLAHLFCSEKSMQIGTNGVQLLGGHGYTQEHPVERWYRDLRSVAMMTGTLCL